jgi:hypothetical protein
MTPQWGFVIAACTALVLLLAFGGIGTSMQLERARGLHPDEAVDGVRAVLRILIVFSLVTPFWSLFDQKASTWVVQANSMITTFSVFGNEFTLLPAQMQALNPLLVMLLIPFNNLVLFPMLQKLGYTPTRAAPHDGRYRLLGPVLAGDRHHPGLDGRRHADLDGLADPAVCAADDGRSAGLGHRPRIRLQPGPGLDEGRDHGPVEPGGHGRQPVGAGRERSRQERRRAGHDRDSGLGVIAFQMYFFAAFALLAAIAFGLYAKRYRMVDHYRSNETAQAPAAVKAYGRRDGGCRECDIRHPASKMARMTPSIRYAALFAFLGLRQRPRRHSPASLRHALLRHRPASGAGDTGGARRLARPPPRPMARHGSGRPLPPLPLPERIDRRRAGAKVQGAAGRCWNLQCTPAPFRPRQRSASSTSRPARCWP